MDQRVEATEMGQGGCDHPLGIIGFAGVVAAGDETIAMSLRIQVRTDQRCWIANGQAKTMTFRQQSASHGGTNPRFAPVITAVLMLVCASRSQHGPTDGISKPWS